VTGFGEQNKSRRKKNKQNKTSNLQIINQAINFHIQGNISEAEKYYKYCINQGFNDHRVFSNYGVILQSIGKLQEAELSYRRAIEINPDFADAYSNLGIILKELGKLQEAELSYRKAIELKPSYAEAHSNLSIVLKDLNKLQEAEVSTRKAIELKPHFTEAHFNLGNILKDLGKLQEAVLSIRKAIELKPSYAEAHYNLGNILKDLGKLQEAKLSYRRAIEYKPSYAEAHCNLGNILKELGELQEAVLSIRKAIEINPDFVDAYSNLGTILRELGELQEAELSYRKAIEIKPDFADAYSNLGIILRELSKLEEAELSYRKAIEIKPDYANAHCNLGNLLKELGKLEDAKLSYQKAIKIKPDYADAYFNLSLVELLQGNYESGLEHYEFREKREKGLSISFKPNIQKADYRDWEKGEKLLVVSEQGLGDTIQFMRYIPYLRNLGLKISFCAQTKLHSLIQFSGIDQNPLSPEDACEVSEGKWIPLLSLPRYLKLSPDNPIISEPYIFSNNELKKRWDNLLSIEKRPVIGINWQGNPDAEKGSLRGRSLPLETFSTIARNNDVKFLSLQKGFGSEQLKNCSFKKKFVQCQSQIDITWDFLENAAIIENCDLIITSDTAIAHLAGGMGKPTWLLLNNLPDWRWGIEKQNTFWYPSMRLIRQKEKYNWQEVMERVSILITKEMKKNA